MEQSNKRAGNDQFACNVCKINFTSHADYALHEFSKKHCDNLLKLAKNKVVIKKPKTKAETPQPEKEQPKVNIVKHTGSFAKYGYFVPGEIYQTAEVSKEFNTDYDPYLQKFAENPYKEQITPVVSENLLTGQNVGFSRKKNKKIKTCQICNISLPTVPEYEAHMKSSIHIWKLKVTGMGVSAHFVKASTDLHTTDVNEEAKEVTEVSKPTSEPTQINDTPSNPFPLLYCQDCELLLNSPQQYNAHVAGKSHIECAKKKAELKAKKEKLETPTPDQLYCYSCKISLNNLFQYNEHKNGKKHRSKCKQLIKSGITIPPEERVPGLPVTKSIYNKPLVYPELYEKFVLEKQKEVSNNFTEPSEGIAGVPAPTPNITSGLYHCNFCSQQFSTVSKYNYHISREHPDANFKLPNEEKSNCDGGGTVPLQKPEIIFHKKITPEPSQNCDDSVLNENSITNVPEIPLQPMEGVNVSDSNPTEPSVETSENFFDEIIIISDGEFIKCNICDQNFQSQTQYDMHVNSEDHMKNILQLKTQGTSDSEILKIMFSDRRITKPDGLGKLSCSICNVTAENKAEFEQHLQSVVHKYALRDYKNRRTTEVNHIVKPNEDNMYHCKLCKEGWSSLVEFTQHLHFAKHRSLQSAERTKKILAKRRTQFLQKQKLLRNSKIGLRIKGEKNPGVRTKISGIATDLYTGAQAPIPNLEPLEPNIDPTKNVTIGVCEKTDTETKKPDQFKMKRSPKQFIRNGDGEEIPPLIHTPESNMCAPGFQPYPRFPRPPYPTPNRYWSPCSFPARPFYGRPPMMNHPFPRPPLFMRPRYPRHSSGYR